MAVVNEEVHYQSANGKDTITAQIWSDDQVQPRGIVQILHGMNEYMGRYENFAGFLARSGYIVCGNDHTGHGKSKGADGYGYFADKDGDKVLVEDVHTFYDYMKKTYPGLDIAMLGHSMGSFILRSYLTKYGEGIVGAIISGTSGANPMAGLGIFMSGVISLFKGRKHPSPFMCKLAFGSYCDRYEKKRTKYDWLTRDEAVVDKYAADEMCNYDFTSGGYGDMLKMVKSITAKDWATKIPKDKPYLLMCGSMDPVGNYGAGVKETYDMMKAAGIENVTMKIYEGGRHEMLNELNKDEVYADLLAWFDRAFAKETANT